MWQSIRWRDAREAFLCRRVSKFNVFPIEVPAPARVFLETKPKPSVGKAAKMPFEQARVVTV